MMLPLVRRFPFSSSGIPALCFMTFLSLLFVNKVKGVRLRPCDVVWDSTMRVALEGLQRQSHSEAFLWHAMEFCYDAQVPAVALTLVGMRSTAMDEDGTEEHAYAPIAEINQDRGFVLQNDGDDSGIRSFPQLQLGVVDGNGEDGHWVAEYMSHHLQELQHDPLLWDELSAEASRPGQAERRLQARVATIYQQRNIDPSSFSLSMALQLRNDDVFFVHHGGTSAQTILVAATMQGSSDATTSVLEHVEVAFNYTSTDEEMESNQTRVYRHSIRKAWELQKDQYTARWQPDATGRMAVDTDGTTTTVAAPPTCTDSPRIEFFLVSATNGIWRYLETEAIIYQLAQALYESSSDKYLVTTANDVIHQAAAQWQIAKRGSFRDDSTLIVAPLRGAGGV